MTVTRDYRYKRFLIGHSFGGLVGSFILTRYPDSFDNAVLICPFLGLWPSIPCMTYDILIRKPFKKKRLIYACILDNYDPNVPSDRS